MVHLLLHNLVIAFVLYHKMKKKLIKNRAKEEGKKLIEHWVLLENGKNEILGFYKERLGLISSLMIENKAFNLAVEI